MSRALWIISAGVAATYAWTIATQSREPAMPSATSHSPTHDTHPLVLAMRNARKKKKERVHVIEHTRSWPGAAGF